MKKRSQQATLTRHHWGGFNPLSPTVPPILRDTASFLLNQKSHALSSEGLFRISGSNLRIRSLKEKYDKGRKVNLDKEDLTVDDVAGLLKLFFRMLPNPLLTFELYDCFLAVIGIPTEFHEQRLECMKQVLDLLPPGNWTIVSFLMRFLTLVADQSDVNKMSNQNLAIVFAPSLMRAPEEEMHEITAAALSMSDSGHAFNVVRFMLDNFEELFGEAAQQAKLEREATAFLSAEAAAASPPVPRQSDPTYQRRRESVMIFQGEFDKGKHKLSAQWTPEVIRVALEEARAERSESTTSIGDSPLGSSPAPSPLSMSGGSNGSSSHQSPAAIRLLSVGSPPHAHPRLRKGSSSMSNLLRRKSSRRKTKQLVPPLLVQCVDYLLQPKNGALHTECLFEVSADPARIKALLKKYKRSKHMDLQNDLQSVHEATGLIIAFLRKASNPVLTYELFDCWVAAAQVVDLESRIVCLEKVLDDLLPAANRAVVARLFSCLHLIAQHEKETRMNSVRLAVIMGPILLRDREESKAPGVETMPAVVVRLLLEHYERLFLKRAKEVNKIASLLESKEYRSSSTDFEEVFSRASMMVGKTKIRESFERMQLEEDEEAGHADDDEDDDDDEHADVSSAPSDEGISELLHVIDNSWSSAAPSAVSASATSATSSAPRPMSFLARGGGPSTLHPSSASSARSVGSSSNSAGASGSTWISGAPPPPNPRPVHLVSSSTEYSHGSSSSLRAHTRSPPPLIPRSSSSASASTHQAQHGEVLAENSLRPLPRVPRPTLEEIRLRRENEVLREQLARVKENTC